jgi:hypothetical protein
MSLDPGGIVQEFTGLSVLLQVSIGHFASEDVLSVLGVLLE